MTMQTSHRSKDRACPFMAGRLCMKEGCMAWEADRCSLILPKLPESASPFELKLRSSAPLMYRSLLDLVGIMEESSKYCQKCGPDLWNYAQIMRTNLLDELTKAELAEQGIKYEK